MVATSTSRRRALKGGVNVRGHPVFRSSAFRVPADPHSEFPLFRTSNFCRSEVRSSADPYSETSESRTRHLRTPDSEIPATYFGLPIYHVSITSSCTYYVIPLQVPRFPFMGGLVLYSTTFPYIDSSTLVGSSLGLSLWISPTR